VMTGVSALTVGLVLLPLFAIFAYLVYKGLGSINLAFLTQTPKPVGEPGGGMANAIVGSMVILAIASLLGVPLGIGAGIFLSEYGRNRYGDMVRFVSDVLNGVPSIVIGIVAYGLVVMRQKHFSALAGGVALAAAGISAGAPLNVRVAPNGKIVGTLNNGLLVAVVDTRDDANGKPWAFIVRASDGHPFGWVFREFIACF